MKPNSQVAEWLAAANVHLLDSGMTAAELELLSLRDGQGKTFAAIGRPQKLSMYQARRKYRKVIRKLHHPTRLPLLPEYFR